MLVRGTSHDTQRRSGRIGSAPGSPTDAAYLIERSGTRPGTVEWYKMRSYPPVLLPPLGPGYVADLIRCLGRGKPMAGALGTIRVALLGPAAVRSACIAPEASVVVALLALWSAYSSNLKLSGNLLRWRGRVFGTVAARGTGPPLPQMLRRARASASSGSFFLSDSDFRRESPCWPV